MVDKKIIDQALLDRMNKKVIHCIEIAPGAYMVSASFAHEIRQRAAKTEVIGDMFGVQIMTSDVLPMIIDNEEPLSNCCSAPMDGEPSNNSSDVVEGRCSDCKEMAEFTDEA